VGLAARPVIGADPPGAPPNDQRLEAHLAAGEFAPALALIEQSAAPSQRDRMLAQVAGAQARSGAADAALATVGRMADDRQRAAALAQLAPATGSAAGIAAGQGGGVQADFDTLIDLITATVAPTTWDVVGGPGAIDGFPGGIYVDAGGVLGRVVNAPAASPDASLTTVHRAAAVPGRNRDPRQASALRKVSLTRLERAQQLRWAAGRPPDQAMRYLAGLERVRYLLVYPETGDLVLAGPAGDWRIDGEGRPASADTGRPVVQLDDLVVIVRNALDGEGRFGCSITPTEENLARTKAYLAETSARPLRENQRNAWLAALRERMGLQAIQVYGIDPGTRVARTLVEADYRMKLVGMGLEPGTLGAASYLERVQVPPGGAPPPLEVLRWWFTLREDAITTTEARHAFELHGQGVQVLSENELLTAQGQRVPTGRAEGLNREFAHDFTRHFSALAEKYPVYADLQNLFDLAVVAALLKAEDLPARVEWHLAHWLDHERCRVGLDVPPGAVDTVLNHRVIDRRHIVAGVSGGVTVDARPRVARPAIQLDDYGLLPATASDAAPPRDLELRDWWWD